MQYDLNKQIGHLNDKMTALFEENMKIKDLNNDLEIKIKELMGEKNLKTMDGLGNGAKRKLNGESRMALLSLRSLYKNRAAGGFITRTI